jgi:hypothetical protein
VDKNRRKFLKIVFIGSGVFLVEKIFGPLSSIFLNGSKSGLRSFHIVENSERLSIYDKNGEEIFQIDKGA